MTRENDIQLFLFIFVGCPLAYVAYLLLPYVFFYLVPFAITSLAVGWYWAHGCEKNPVSYRHGVPFMAMTLVLLAIVVGFPDWHVENIKVEWPYLYRMFNGFNEDIQSSINWSWLRYFRKILPGLPPVDYEPVLYDRVHLAWTLWLGAIIGAPVVFFHIAQVADRTEIADLKNALEEKRKEYQSEAQEARQNYYRERSARKEEGAQKDAEIAKLKEVNEQLKKGILSLPPAALSQTPQSNIDEKTENEEVANAQSSKIPGIFDGPNAAPLTLLPSGEEVT